MVGKTSRKTKMSDKEKVLRWNLQEAKKEMNKPTDIGGNLIASVSFGIIASRKKHLKKCETELEEYLNQNKDDNK